MTAKRKRRVFKVWIRSGSLAALEGHSYVAVCARKPYGIASTRATLTIAPPTRKGRKK